MSAKYFLSILFPECVPYIRKMGEINTIATVKADFLAIESPLPPHPPPTVLEALRNQEIIEPASGF